MKIRLLLTPAACSLLAASWALACGSAESNTSSSGGSGGANGSGGVSGSAGAATTATGLPCEIEQLLQANCVLCHSDPPVASAPMPLVTRDDLLAPALSDPSRMVAELCVDRMLSTTSPMPPGAAPTISADSVARLSGWIDAGTPEGACSGDSPSSPYDTATVCSSGQTFVGDRQDPPDPREAMFPGEACITCHLANEGEPKLVVGGTVYPTAHEPDSCLSTDVPSDAEVLILDASGNVQLTLPVGANGNFSLRDGRGELPNPFTAKVVAGGKERVMTTPQTSGDCNSCHTVDGANGAPGRIMLP